ncbi:MAG: hypothetical protein ACRCUT_09315, partial [Spirochaetota bacterium]
GNPAYEQFNIDIKYLPVNRYIGSHSIVHRFLAYQKIFGLDLTNASVVDAEKDIPEISKTSAVSDRESFIGIFYRDGNFKIGHSRKDLFDLNENYDSPCTGNGLHDLLAKNAKTKRYAGAGMVLIDGNPIFYKNSSFVSYLFPLRYFTSFNNLGINPRSIQAVIYPSENFFPISRFLKWKHEQGSRITVYSDCSGELSLVKALFSKARIQTEPFSGMNSESLSGAVIRQIPHSFNISISLETPGGEVFCAFVKGNSALKSIIKEKKFDCLFVPYSVYEDSLLMLRSSQIPVAVIDDGNPAVAKVPRMDHLVLKRNAQYEFTRCTEENEILHAINQCLPEDITRRIIQKDYPFIEKLCAELAAGQGDYTPDIAANISTLMIFLVDTCSDRKLSSFLKNTVRDLLASSACDRVDENISRYRFELVFTGKSVYAIVHPVQDAAPERIFCFEELRDEIAKPPAGKESLVYERIMRDRERLEKLLSLYKNNPAFREETEALRSEISRRKEIFEKDQFSLPEKNRNFIHDLRSAVTEAQRAPETESRMNTPGTNIRKKERQP